MSLLELPYRTTSGAKIKEMYFLTVLEAIKTLGGPSLAVEWLRLWASIAGGVCLIPGQGN